jgi:serine/threonine protein kinase
MPVNETKRAAVALLIGIGDYLHADRVPRLAFAPNDARALARLLANGDLCRFPRDRVALLTGPRARRDAVVHRLASWLPAQARGAEIAVIYFAGHGLVQTVGGKEEGFLLPYDADPDDVVTRGVAMSDLARWIEGVEAAAVVVCLDCCHAGKVILRDGVSLRSAPRDLVLRPAVMEGIAGKGRFLIASCDEGQKSLEVEELKHGLFTYHLLEGIKGAADRDRDGRVGVAELFNYVSAAVAREARAKFGLEQRPWAKLTLTEEAYVSFCPPAAEGPGGLGPLERLWREAGVAGVREEMGRRAAAGDREWLIALLRFLRKARDPAGVPLVFGCLAHEAEAVRERARKAVHALGWEQTTAAVEELARRGDEADVGPVLEGLAAFEAHADVVRVLDRLVVLLRGNLRNRAIFLLERKRLGLELEKVAALFRELRSPYRIHKVLGPGLFTAAYLAREELTGLEVVVRVLRPEFANQPLVRGHFLDLSRRSVRFVHHNLLLTREARAFPDQDIYYTVRDYVAGATLREVLAGGKRFEPPQVIRILRQVVEALTPLHQDGACHGGVKPSNIFLAREDRVILGDPALPVPPPTLDLKRLSYDFRYVPPEMFAGGGLGPASDFYALGCVAHELLYGEPPFVSDNPYELIAMHGRDPVPVLPADPGRVRWTSTADRILGQLLAKTPAGRLDRAGEVLEALGDLEQAWQAPDLMGPVGEPGPRSGRVSLLGDASLLRYGEQQSLLPLEGSPSGTFATGVGWDRPAEASRFPGEPSSLPTIPGYEILEELGRGGMAVVYKARQLSLNRLVALKMILARPDAESPELTRFRREAVAVARLQHPNIVQIFDIGEQDRLTYYSMEFMEGGNLARKLGGSPQAATEAARLVEVLARAMHYAHQQGIVHRDLKPANVLLSARGEPKITDFGLVKLLDRREQVHTQEGQIVGTPAYMAPEQAAGKSTAVGPATDVHALGAMLYEMLTGQPPFRAETIMDTILQVVSQPPKPPHLLQPKVPRDLEGICLKCLEKDPARRYPSAAALADDLERFLAGAPVMARPAGLWRRFLRWLPFFGR